MTEDIGAIFASAFGAAPAAIGTGHGRVNLIGEHTDYNEGFVMPCILSHATHVALALRDDDAIHGHSTGFGPRRRSLRMSSPATGLPMLPGPSMTAEAGAPRRGVDLAVDSTVPAGAGSPRPPLSAWRFFARCSARTASTRHRSRSRAAGTADRARVHRPAMRDHGPYGQRRRGTGDGTPDRLS